MTFKVLRVEQELTRQGAGGGAVSEGLAELRGTEGCRGGEGRRAQSKAGGSQGRARSKLSQVSDLGLFLSRGQLVEQGVCSRTWPA